MRLCKIEGCDNKHYAKGLCSFHYQRKKDGIPFNQPKQVQEHGKYTHCTYKNCKEKHHGKGLCKFHRERKRKGRPLDAPKREQRSANMSLKETVEWALKQTKQVDGCLEWKKSLSESGYAQTGYQGKKRLVTHLVLEHFKGKAPKGKPFALHKCHNPKCVDYKHLYWGSPKNNSKDIFDVYRKGLKHIKLANKLKGVKKDKAYSILKKFDLI